MCSWRLGRILGFPVNIKAGFFLLLLLATMGAFGGVGGVVAIGFVLTLFASVLLHELGHAVVARQRGVGISGIDLGFLGGAAKMTSLPQTANDEIAIAAAGPAVSLLLAGLGFGTAFALAAAGLSAGSGVAWFAKVFGTMNVVIALFNLLPALPMDGGRILRALLSRWSSYVVATNRSVIVSRVFAVAFLIFGVIYSLQLALLAPVLWLMGSHERLVARMMAPQFTQSPSGYRTRRFDEIEVMPRGFDPYRSAYGGYSASTGADPFSMFGFGRAGSGGRRINIVRRNGKIVIEIDPQ